MSPEAEHSSRCHGSARYIVPCSHDDRTGCENTSTATSGVGWLPLDRAGFTSDAACCRATPMEVWSQTFRGQGIQGLKIPDQKASKISFGVPCSEAKRRRRRYPSRSFSPLPTCATEIPFNLSTGLYSYDQILDFGASHTISCPIALTRRMSVSEDGGAPSFVGFQKVQSGLASGASIPSAMRAPNRGNLHRQLSRNECSTRKLSLSDATWFPWFIVCVVLLLLLLLLRRVRSVTRELHMLKKVQEGAKCEADFWATISHEIRTRVTCVIGTSAFLTELPLSDEASEYVETIAASSRALQDLLNDVLGFSKINSGKLSVVARPFNVRETLERLVKVMRATYLVPEKDRKHRGSDMKAAAPIQLHLDIDPSLPKGLMLGDEVRIRQCLLNLLTNAFKFTDSGHIIVRASCSPMDHAPGGSTRGAEDAPPAGSSASASFGRIDDEASRRSISWPGPHPLERSWADVKACSRWISARCSSQSQQGGEEVTPVSYLANAHRRMKLTISVEDTGIGLSEEHVKQLFQPFVQVHQTSSRRSVRGSDRGTGLGLAICHALSIAMGGHTSCRSKLGQGSVFDFSCILGFAEEDEQAKNHDSQRTKKYSVRNDSALRRVTSSCKIGRSPQCISSTLSELATGAMREKDALTLNAFEAALLAKDDEWEEDAPVSPNAIVTETDHTGQCLDGESHRPLSRRARGLQRRQQILSGVAITTDADRTIEIAQFVGAPTEFQDGDRVPQPLLTALVVDDSAVNRRLMQRTLIILGIESSVAASGEEAVALCKSERFFVIFMDVHMPGKYDGAEATKLIREGGGFSADSPIIAFTATHTDSEIDAAKQFGMDGMIVKPPALHMLVEQLVPWASSREIIHMHNAWISHQRGPCKKRSTLGSER